MEFLHTPLFQRLYNLKQLGFADRVFPDAVHSRFNHVLGVTEVAERMARRLHVWLGQHEYETFKYANDRVAQADKDEIHEITGKELAGLVESRIPSIRLFALLHDITHAAFGHTLEDEVRVFSEKHDDPTRQIRFFDALVAQLVYIWCTEARIRDADPSVLDRLGILRPDPDEFKAWVEEIAAFLDLDSLQPGKRRLLAAKLRELEIALRLLLRLEFLHEEPAQEKLVPPLEPLLVTEAIEILDPKLEALDLALHRDAFMIDLVGNTICADLLDYGRRDAQNSGLKVQFDERLIKYLTIVSVKEDRLSPTYRPCLRIALQFFTDKMRYDVLSEMSLVLKARYVITERVLFHPTKCAVGGLLGTAVQLVGIKALPAWIQVLGDQEFLAELTTIATYLSTFCTTYRPGEDYLLALSSLWGNVPEMPELLHQCIKGITGAPGNVVTEAQCSQIADRAHAARRLCWNLSARRYPKLAFRLRNDVQQSGGATFKTIAEEYVDPQARFDLERNVERTCGLPLGTLVIHCPRSKGQMKLADVLVVGRDLTKAAKLRDLTNVSPESLGPYMREIRAIEEMYLSIWQFHAFLDSAYFEKQPVVAWVLEKELGFINDRLLAEELALEPASVFRVLATDLHDDVAPNRLTSIISEVDTKMAGLRLRHEQSPSNTREWLLGIIQSVNTQATPKGQTRLFPKN